MSRLPSKWNVWSITLLALLAIGLMVSVINSPSSFIIPILVLGGIFLLYKYPPSFIRGNSSSQSRTYVTQNRPSSVKPKTKKTSTKTVPFRVIEGGKEDDDLPKYH